MAMYNAAETIVLIGGRKITGFYGDEPIKAGKEEPHVTLEEDHNGYGVHSVSNSKAGWVEITLSQASSDLEYVMGLRGQMVPVWLHNNSDVSEKAGGTRAMIEADPEMSIGKKAGGRTFKFLVADFEYTMGS